MNGEFGVYNKKNQLLTVEGDVNLTDKIFWNSKLQKLLILKKKFF